MGNPWSPHGPNAELYEERERLKQARDALLVSDAISKMAAKYGPELVMDTVRYWLGYMDKQAAHIDGGDHAGS